MNCQIQSTPQRREAVALPVVIDQLFPLGALVITPAAAEALQGVGVEPLQLIRRHVQGDFSDMSEDDQTSNREAIGQFERIFTAYNAAPGLRVWVITEADRSATTVLLPGDY